MERAITDLCQLSDPLLFEEVAKGISHLIDGVSELDAAAQILSRAEHHYPARLLGNLAEEEASKVLILMDAIRCPRERSQEMSRLLRCFYNHLSKRIYAEACKWGGIITFDEMRRAVEREREEYYLDGPNDVDWIFPNKLTQRREDDLYVNYVREDGNGNRYWTSPKDHSTASLFPYHRRTPMAVSVAQSLHRVAATSPFGLNVVAEIWRPIKMVAEFNVDELRKLNRCTVETLGRRGLVQEPADDAAQIVLRTWQFPLYDLDLNVRKIDRRELKHIQQNWSPQ